MSGFLEIIGEQVRTIRISKQLTQRVIAEKSGFSDSYISDIERGKRNISLESLEKIMKALGVTPFELFNFKAIEVENGLEDKQMIIEILKSFLLERRVDEIKLLHRIARDMAVIVDK